MYELKNERYLRVNLLGPGPGFMKKGFTGRGLKKVEKHWSKDNSYLQTRTDYESQC